MCRVWQAYTTNDLFTRYQNFKTILNEINEHNAMNASWTAGLNEWSDMSHEEFVATHTGRIQSSNVHTRTVDAAAMRLLDPTNDVDWRSKGAVTPGMC